MTLTFLELDIPKEVSFVHQLTQRFHWDSIQVPVPQNFINHHEFLVEPLTKFKENWPEPSIIKNDQLTFALYITTKLAISIKRNQIIVQIQNVYHKEDFKTIKINHRPTHLPSNITRLQRLTRDKSWTKNQSHPQQREQFNNINMYVCIMSQMGFRVNPHTIVV